jgi:hypothetical protein
MSKDRTPQERLADGLNEANKVSIAAGRERAAEVQRMRAAGLDPAAPAKFQPIAASAAAEQVVKFAEYPDGSVVGVFDFGSKVHVDADGVATVLSGPGFDQTREEEVAEALESVPVREPSASALQPIPDVDTPARPARRKGITAKDE